MGWARVSDLEEWSDPRLHGMQRVDARISIASCRAGQSAGVPAKHGPSTVEGAHGGQLVGAGRAYAFKMVDSGGNPSVGCQHKIFSVGSLGVRIAGGAVWSWDRRRVRRPTEAVGVDCVPVHDRRRRAHDACCSSDPGGRLGCATRGPGGRAADCRRGQKQVSVHSAPEGCSVPPLAIVSWVASLPGTTAPGNELAHWSFSSTDAFGDVAVQGVVRWSAEGVRASSVQASGSAIR